MELLPIKPTPKQRLAILTILNHVYGNIKTSMLLFGGAIRGGKTYAAIFIALMLCEIFPRSRWAIIRKNAQRIRENTIPSFNKLIYENPYIKGELRYSPEIKWIHHNESEILFKGENLDRDPDLDKYKGFECNGFIFEEMNECSYQMFLKGIERAGSWIIPGMTVQPHPFVMGTCNPTWGWVKEKIYDPYERGELPDNWKYIPAKITDNPYLPESYKEALKMLPKFEYLVFVEGDWNVRLKTGGEFLKAFELNDHVRQVYYDSDKTIHVSIDNNVLPYIAISLWQIDKKEKGYVLNKFHEIAAEDPNNTARRAGKTLLKYLREIDYADKIYLYGDATTKQRNTIDDENKSFLTLFEQPLKDAGYKIDERFFRSNPPVASTGEFINEILENNIYDIEIFYSETCIKSINDNIEIKEDKDGNMLKIREKHPKSGAAYEPYGHFLDTDRYFICKVLENEYKTFRQRFANYSDATIPKPKGSYLMGGF